MLISRLMTYKPTTVSSQDNLQTAATLMERGGFRRVPVVDGDALVGIISDRDVRRHVGYLQSTKITAAMTPDPKTVTPKMSVEDAARLMISHKIGGLPVVENGRLVGIVSTSDILKAFLNVVQATQGILNE